MLDDDEDMAELYLTEKLLQQNLENSSASTLSENDNMDDEVLGLDMDDRHVLISVSF